MSRLITLTVAPLSFAFASPAVAELPQPVRDMITAALETGDPAKVETVIDLAIKTNPDDVDELKRIHSVFRDEQAKRAAQRKREEVRVIRQAGVFDRWGGKGELGGFYSTGNTDEIGITVALSLERTGIDWIHKLRGRGDFRRTNGETTREQLLGAYEPRYQIDDTLFAYSLGQYERDRFQGYTARWSVSGGLGYMVLDKPGTQLSIKAGPAWRHTEYTIEGSETYLAGLAALDLNWTITKNMKLTEDAEVYLQDGNSSFSSDTGMEVAIASNLRARLSYSLQHDTDPPPGAVKTDTTSRMSLVYDF